MKILHIISDGFQEANSTIWRASNFLSACYETQKAECKLIYSTDWVKQTKRNNELCSWADFIIVHRIAIRESINAIRKWREKGKVVILDFDDGYKQLNTDDGNPAGEFWLLGKANVKIESQKYQISLEEHPLKLLEEAIGVVNAVTVPSLQLVQDWKHFGNVFYLENYIKADRYVHPKYQNDGIYLGWGGSLGHLMSFQHSGIVEAINKINNENPKVKLFLVGDKRIIDKCKIKNAIYKPYVVYYDWVKMLSQYDIGLAPLSGEFDMRRSPIKLTEYTTYGLPFVATNCHVYRNYFGTNSGIFVDNNEKSWYNGIFEVVENLDVFSARAIENIHIGQSYDIAKNMDNVLDLYREIKAKTQ